MEIACAVSHLFSFFFFIMREAIFLGIIWQLYADES